MRCSRRRARAACASIAGKVLMDRHAPDGLRDDVDGAERDCRELIERWHGRGRLAYALTVRFAPTSTPAQLAMAGRLAAADPGALHADARGREPRRGALGGRAVPRGAQLPRRLRARRPAAPRARVRARHLARRRRPRALRDAGAQIAFCPSSNLFLGSGLFDWHEAAEAGVRVSVATDVGGGTSLSMLRTLADAYKVQALAGAGCRRGRRCTARPRRGAGARARRRDRQPRGGPARRRLRLGLGRRARRERRMDVAREVHERVFAWMTLADERNLVETYVAGTRRFERG